MNINTQPRWSQGHDKPVVPSPWQVTKNTGVDMHRGPRSILSRSRLGGWYSCFVPW